MAGQQLDPSKLDPDTLANLTNQLRDGLARIREGQAQKGQDTSQADDGLAQLDGLKDQLAALVETQFVSSIDQMAHRCFSNSLAHEFWTPASYAPTATCNVGRNDGEAIALMHSEASELLEAARDEEMRESKKIPGFTQAEEEAADLVIRVMDYAVGRKIRLGAAILAKHHYNIGRPPKHGRRF